MIGSGSKERLNRALFERVLQCWYRVLVGTSPDYPPLRSSILLAASSQTAANSRSSCFERPILDVIKFVAPGRRKIAPPPQRPLSR